MFIISVVAEEVGELGLYLCIRPLERFEHSCGYKPVKIDCDFQSDIDELIYLSDKWDRNLGHCSKWKKNLGHCFLVLARYLGTCNADDGSGRQLKILKHESAFGFGGTGSSGKSEEVFPESEKIFQGKMPIAGMRLFSKKDLSSRDWDFNLEIEQVW